MANPQRGEIAAVIEGEEKVLCLTLGALAELEARLQAGRWTNRERAHHPCTPARRGLPPGKRDYGRPMGGPQVS